MATHDDTETAREFHNLVNLTAKRLGDWLETEDSKAVGQKDGDGESTGHHSGRQIVEILGEKRSDYSNDDYAHMRKVIGYIKRHSAQRPDGDIEDTPWRSSLMNWGHDPLKQ
ncbi:MAG TPA: DUF3140 domain-containing protein [Thermomicrobiales bacterium]|nr:DUF3140 domain-containing protein [Thermomicrobiales bacterium]